MKWTIGCFLMSLLVFAADDEIRQLSGANNIFGCELHRKLAGDGNLVHSPYGLSVTLAMAYAGATGDMRDQMAKVLHFDQLANEPHPAFAATKKALNAANKGTRNTLAIANSVWVSKGLDLLPPYVEAIRRHHEGAIYASLLGNAPRIASEQINAWANRQTRGMIPSILAPDALNDQTKLVLVNAIYFRGIWQSQFDSKNTLPRIFHISPANMKNVPTMGQQSAFRTWFGDRLHYIELPYNGNRMVMFVLVPGDKDTLPGLERRLSRDLLNECSRNASRQEVILFLPKWTIESNHVLEQALAEMGMPDAFNGKASFTRIVKDPVNISFLGQKAKIEVDEIGTRAVAVSAAGFELSGLSGEPPLPVFAADRPFLFLLAERSTGTILFMGRVTDPTDR